MTNSSERKLRREKVSSYPISQLAEELGFTVVPVGSGGKYLSLQEHDSVRIYPNNTFIQFSTGEGNDPVSFLNKFGTEMTGNNKYKSVDYCIYLLEVKMKKKALSLLKILWNILILKKLNWNFQQQTIIMIRLLIILKEDLYQEKL